MRDMSDFMNGKRRLKDKDYMEVALEVAHHAKSEGNLPVGAVLAWIGGRQLVEHDTRYTDKNPLNYAIINVINKAAETFGRKRLSEAVLYTTIEPDLMCALAIQKAGIKEVVFGAYDEKEGYLSSKLLVNNTLLNISSIGGILGQKCCDLLPENMQEHVHE